jgi:hypothetical protein
VADSRIVLNNPGPEKRGNGVEGKTQETGEKPKRERAKAENPPLATVNTHLVESLD